MKTFNLYQRRQGFALVFLLLLALSALSMQAFAQAVDPRTEGPLRIEFNPPNPQPGKVFEVRVSGRIADEPANFLATCQLTGGVQGDTLSLDTHASLSPGVNIPRNCTQYIGPLNPGRYKYILYNGKGLGVPLPPILSGFFDVGTVEEVTRPVPSLSMGWLLALVLLLGGVGYRYAQQRKNNSLSLSLLR